MKQFLSIFLALLVLGSNMGISLAVHFCGGRAVSGAVSVGTAHAKGCGMELLAQPSGCEDGALASKSCCQDQVQALDMDDTVVAWHFAMLSPFILPSPAWALPQMDAPSASRELLRYANYSPPPIERDRLALFQTYLI